VSDRRRGIGNTLERTHLPVGADDALEDAIRCAELHLAQLRSDDLDECQEREHKCALEWTKLYHFFSEVFHDRKLRRREKTGVAQSPWRPTSRNHPATAAMEKTAFTSP